MRCRSLKVTFWRLDRVSRHPVDSVGRQTSACWKICKNVCTTQIAFDSKRFLQVPFRTRKCTARLQRSRGCTSCRKSGESTAPRTNPVAPMIAFKMPGAFSDERVALKCLRKTPCQEVTDLRGKRAAVSKKCQGGRCPHETKQAVHAKVAVYGCVVVACLCICVRSPHA